MYERALGDVLRLTMGQSPPGSTCNSTGQGTPLLNGPTEFGSRHPVPVQWTTNVRRFCNKNAVLLCVRGSTTGRTNLADQKYAIGRGVAAIEADDPTDQLFAYYALSSSIGSLLERTTGSVFPNLSRDDIATHSIPWPNRDSRRAIAEVLGALDDKIEANRTQLRIILELADSTYREAIEHESTLASVGDVAQFHNSRRVPLSSRERERRAGPFPYFGAAGRIDSVDDFLFDGDFLLVGEDGTVVVNGNRPMVQYVWGRFWVNNHAHVLTGAAVATSVLRVALNSVDITSAVTGAVQPKLNMGNLKNVDIVLPRDPRPLGDVLDAMAAREKSLSHESELLAAVREALLPKLLSGELRVRDAESIVGEAV
jgi:type I restriction enzyme S subunit